jgi:hypothetical protein
VCQDFGVGVRVVCGIGAISEMYRHRQLAMNLKLIYTAGLGFRITMREKKCAAELIDHLHPIKTATISN